MDAIFTPQQIDGLILAAILVGLFLSTIGGLILLDGFLRDWNDHVKHLKAKSEWKRLMEEGK